MALEAKLLVRAVGTKKPKAADFLDKNTQKNAAYTSIRLKLK